mmetsp:Transcript_37794/g.67751  ORF Transcript_37794/g.67751 Transcript_37794/m.67751 type:complete len:339 (-) Transcript_37794:800-1816(-)
MGRRDEARLLAPSLEIRHTYYLIRQRLQSHRENGLEDGQHFGLLHCVAAATVPVPLHRRPLGRQNALPHRLVVLLLRVRLVLHDGPHRILGLFVLNIHELGLGLLLRKLFVRLSHILRLGGHQSFAFRLECGHLFARLADGGLRVEGAHRVRHSAAHSLRVHRIPRARVEDGRFHVPQHVTLRHHSLAAHIVSELEGGLVAQQLHNFLGDAVPQGVAADAKANTVRHHQRLDVRHQWVLALDEGAAAEVGAALELRNDLKVLLRVRHAVLHGRPKGGVRHPLVHSHHLLPHLYVQRHVVGRDVNVFPVLVHLVIQVEHFEHRLSPRLARPPTRFALLL